MSARRIDSLQDLNQILREHLARGGAPIVMMATHRAPFAESPADRRRRLGRERQARNEMRRVLGEMVVPVTITEAQVERMIDVGMIGEDKSRNRAELASVVCRIFSDALAHKGSGGE
ncbi:MAG: hypothetical protein KF723_22705 [Rhizobiaceae bacterium]|nr:hypothetical protein [Rhizobiaceae bacterium]